MLASGRRGFLQGLRVVHLLQHAAGMCHGHVPEGCTMGICHRDSPWWCATGSAPAAAHGQLSLPMMPHAPAVCPDPQGCPGSHTQASSHLQISAHSSCCFHIFHTQLWKHCSAGSNWWIEDDMLQHQPAPPGRFPALPIPWLLQCLTPLRGSRGGGWRAAA